jgi:FkbH-like protein
MVKMVIWDLDDTLWSGTLADGDEIVLFEQRAELVRALNAHGVVSSICSKNDPAVAQAKLEALGLWDEFVFPHIAFTPKAAAVIGIIDDMQLRARDVLFVDDNPINLNEVLFALPDIEVLDARDPAADARLRDILGAQPASRNRLDEYRILERKKQDRDLSGGSNEDFLKSCQIKACAPYLMDNLDFSARIAELINRSNQLNYTQSRVEQAALEAAIIDVVAYDSWSIFAWDRYGDYGLVGFVMVDRRTTQFVHFVFSCRAMHMGLETFALGKVREKWPAIDGSPLESRFGTAKPDWIEDRSFHDGEVRKRLIAGQIGGFAEQPCLRIMFDCQSGGIAHFSRNRGRIDFDNNPRLFALRSVDDGSHLDQDYAPFVVYGAGIDYSDPRWPGLAPLLEQGLYRECVRSLCAFFAERGIRAMIVLPPDDAPEAMYRPQLNHTRERTQRFNREWWSAAAEWSCIDVVDLSGQAVTDEMADVSHYKPGLLRELAETIDLWLEGVGAAELGIAA